MKAIIVTEESLSWQDVPPPELRDNEALVDVYATALNRADLMQRAGHYPPPPGASAILGLELAGVISKLPDSYQGVWKEGDQVCALVTGGSYAEQAAVPLEMLMPIPANWSMQQAAALPEAYLTAYLNLFLEAQLQVGETVLIHGGGSGVGTAAIQLSSASDCHVITTAGSAEKLAVCQQIGANLAINYKEQDFAAVVKQQALGVDVILDMVGGDYFERNIELLGMAGRLVFISTLSGATSKLDIRKLMAKRLMLKGSTLRGRPLAEKVVLKERFMTQFWDSLETGSITPVIDSVYPIEKADSAHERMRRNQNIGKIVLNIIPGE